jgi:hypothetical protein
LSIAACFAGAPRVFSQAQSELCTSEAHFSSAAEIDLGDVPICQLCLLELAWEIRDGRKPSRGLIKRTVEWIWSESGESLKEAVVRARMDERPHAEEALRDLELINRRYGRFAEAVVMRFALENGRRDERSPLIADC